ncbi:bifunctional hydroxymethylpyrimidine kinase/phosphomethylpyrimidine kinase [Kushneria marisflavi]|uniref:hydroxymethylpyrimidine kinase n=1 Tax=Kushneria marisflavi TaxID=157779 RepID=A0A240UP56_9GAMM|nr:hydroxymethylpyrimidine/phosphomethylpyrimidine kinase [Kushneria marisflavi]ART63274.1 hydroxymethylpyrimidine/phosphomethylpyrimidine kinase [Kushneria marisflavi]RKD84306.1 hydroxymethylpyrimidine/phosphomethylpyrimidine kinase [Kushneria marisflavi]
MSLPCVLVLAGHDPTGGAGLIADAEAIRAMGGWALTVPTALTCQTTVNVQSVTPRPGEEILATARALLEDCDIHAIKVGLIADLSALEAVVELCRTWSHLPVIIDPVLKAGGGRELSGQALRAAFVERLLPLADLVTPNLDELARLTDRALADQDTAGQAGQMLATGAGAVLATGTDVADAQRKPHVTHRLYTPEGFQTWSWPRLPGSYHGSGCTLASATAALLARGETLDNACQRAQQFTWQSLERALTPGRGQYLPDRLSGPFHLPIQERAT